MEFENISLEVLEENRKVKCSVAEVCKERSEALRERKGKAIHRKVESLKEKEKDITPLVIHLIASARKDKSVVRKKSNR